MSHDDDNEERRESFKVKVAYAVLAVCCLGLIWVTLALVQR